MSGQKKSGLKKWLRGAGELFDGKSKKGKNEKAGCFFSDMCFFVLFFISG
jgi:hypothetical protein